MEFRTRKDKRVYPVNKSGNKTYKREYNSNPDFFTKTQIHSDVKRMHRNDDPSNPADHNREYDNYRRKIQLEADKQFIREKKKQTKRHNRSMKKEEKVAKKQSEQMENQAKQDFAQDQVKEERQREDLKEVGVG